MTGPAFGLLWYIVLRQRFGLTFALAVMSFALITAGIAAHSLSPFARFCCVDVFGFGSVYLLGILTNADGDMASVGSGYPRHLLLLPLSTRSLVLWPMALAAATVGGTGLLFSGLLLGISAGSGFLWWPAVMLVSISSCLQAAMWYPYGRPYLRGLATVSSFAVPLLLACFAWLLDLSSNALCGIYAGITATAVLVAYRGVFAARQGGVGERDWSLRSIARRKNITRPNALSANALPPFAGAMQAQVWMEWQRNGKMLPLFVGAGCIVAGLLFTMLSVVADSPPVPFGIDSIVTSELARVELLVFPVAVLCAALVGCCCNRSETLRRDLTMQPFQATRPLTCAEVVSAKLRMAARSALAAGAILAVYLGVWLLQPAQEGSRNAPLGMLLLSHSTPSALVLAVIAFCGVLCLIWVFQVSGLSIELSGREWIFNLYGVVLSICMLSAVVGLGYVVLERPRGLLFLEHAAPYLLSLLVAGKGVLALAACRAVRRRGLITGAALARAAMLWCLAIGGLFIVAAYAVPTSIVPRKYVVLSIVLAAPATRLLSASLSLLWNRTR